MCGPRLWNSLPVELRQPHVEIGQFRRLLKTFLSENVAHVRLRSQLTYLHAYLVGLIILQLTWFGCSSVSSYSGKTEHLLSTGLYLVDERISFISHSVRESNGIPLVDNIR